MIATAMMEHTHEKTAYTKLAWIVTLTSALYFFYVFIQMNLFNTINLQLRQAFQLDAVEFGQFFSMFFYANALFLLPAGNLLDRYSTKKLLLFAAGISTIGTFIFALSNQYWAAAFGRFIVGVGASFCFLSCIRIASRWFSPHRMAFVTGVIVTMAMLGGLSAQAPFTFLIEYLGSWREALLLDAFLGIAIFFAVVFIVQDWPPDASPEMKAQHEHIKQMGIMESIKLAALNPQNWLGGLYTALLNAPVFILGGLWGILYLTEVHGLAKEQAAYATTIFFLGVIFGSPAFGWFSDKIGRRVFPMLIGAILSLGVILILMYVPNLSPHQLMILFFLIGFVTSAQVLTYPTIAELNPSYLTSTAVSIDSICIMSSGFIIPPLFGWLMERIDARVMIAGVPHYGAASFNNAMVIFPIGFIIAFFIAFLIRETYCRAQS